MGFFNFFKKQQDVMNPTDMNIQAKGLDFISRFEGLYRKGRTQKYAPSNVNLKNESPDKYYVYIDPVGLPTIGIGHLLTKSELSSGIISINGRRVNYKNGLTLKEVYDLKTQDSVRFIKAVQDHIKVPLTQGMFDAIVSWAFNVGSNRVKPSQSTLSRKLNAGDYKGAADELLRWNKAGGRVINGLTRRRKAEREMFLKDIDKVA